MYPAGRDTESGYATTYRAVFSSPRGAPPVDRLLDALVELLVRLHLSGFCWGDCSLSNALFRADAGTLQAYLVDTETSERHPTLTDGRAGCWTTLPVSAPARSKSMAGLCRRRWQRTGGWRRSMTR